MKKQVILITGASSGMGKEAALKLISEGHIVYGAARRLDKMNDLIKAGGHALKMDITKSDETTTAVNRIIAEQGRIDVLINNAGYAVYGSVEDVSIEDAQRQFGVNIFGLADLTKKVIPHMRKQGSGKIMNVSSVGGKIYTPLGAWYHATKHALEGWSDSLRLELKQFGIDVVIIEPGIIKTEFTDVMLQPMIDRTSEPYKPIANSLKEASQKSYSQNRSSHPSVVANTMLKAVKSKKPKTRYATGKFAKPFIFMRKLLTDRMFDRLILNQVK